jgi:hypothetical protein
MYCWIPTQLIIDKGAEATIDLFARGNRDTEGVSRAVLIFIMLAEHRCLS